MPGHCSLEWSETLRISHAQQARETNYKDPHMPLRESYSKYEHPKSDWRQQVHATLQTWLVAKSPRLSWDHASHVSALQLRSDRLTSQAIDSVSLSSLFLLMFPLLSRMTEQATCCRRSNPPKPEQTIFIATLESAPVFSDPCLSFNKAIRFHEWRYLLVKFMQLRIFAFI